MALIVDDEPPIRRVVRRTLEAEQWSVLEARDGAEALRIVALTPGIDLLVTDLEMPVMSGKQLAAAARLLQPRMRVLHMTGFVDTFMAGGPIRDNERLIAKPFTRGALVDALTMLFYGRLEQPVPPIRHARAVRRLS